jgi:hypothetical protein
VGTNIDCRATAGRGPLSLEMTVEHSAIYPPQPEAHGGGHADVPLVPLRLRARPADGQSQRYTTATDPVSGEVVKIDVTLTALK